MKKKEFEKLLRVENKNGPTLVYSASSGVRIIEKDGLFFKDLSKDGKLDIYEDWRLSSEERAADLASKLSVEQMAGLMIFSEYHALPESPQSGYLRWKKL